MKKIKFAVIGSGRLGTNLAIQLQKAGHIAVGLCAKHVKSIECTNRLLNVRLVDTIPWKVTPQADVVFITTPDDLIERTCKQVSANQGFKQHCTVFHCSGSLSSQILTDNISDDHDAGSLHPLQSFPVKHIEPNPFENIYMSVEGSEKAIELGKAFAKDLKANVAEISSSGKQLYHTAAVVASNYLVTLLWMAQQLNMTAGIPESIALKVLNPLIEGTLANIQKQGIPSALTGPISRGDIQTVHNHIEKIINELPEVLDLYKMLGRYTVPLAQKQCNISEKMAKSFQEKLS